MSRFQIQNGLVKTDINIDNIITILLDEDSIQYRRAFQLSTKSISGLCEKAKTIFMSQPMLLELDAPLKICGDVHGQFSCLINLFEVGGYPPASKYLFLGDYVDRGKQSLETIMLMLAYKVKYPDKFYMLRGNHECDNINRIYGFYDECKRRCDSTKVWKIFTDVFNCLPVAAVINNRIFCCHGGLSPKLKSMKQIRRIKRPCFVPKHGILCDLMWADPDKSQRGWQFNKERGISFTFGIDVIDKFIKKQDFDLIVRGHEVVEDGYQFFAAQKLVTVFSAPNYCGMFTNRGGIMIIDEHLHCSFDTFNGDFHTPNRRTAKELNEENKTTYAEL